MIDVDALYKKLVNNEALTEDESIDALKEIKLLRVGVAHLASCQAATLEGLPKSASKSEGNRQREICLTAAKILKGDITAVRYPTKTEHAIERCMNAASAVRPLDSGE